MYEDIAQMKNITLHPQIDIPDNLHNIMGDVDRVIFIIYEIAQISSILPPKYCNQLLQ